MDYRKVQVMGGSTVLVSLPKKWADRHNVRKGDLIAIQERADGSLVISKSAAEPTEASEVTIAYSSPDLEALTNDITSQYLLGHDFIRIVGEGRFSLEERERVKEVVRRLVGLEIIEEDTESLTIQCLLEHTSLDPHKLLVRMHMLTSAMHRDAIISLTEGDTHLSEIVVRRDDEIDRLYFLVVRLLRSAVQNPSLADRYGLSPIDCLDFRVAANLIENIGDLATDVARTVSVLPRIDLTGALASALQQASFLLEELQENAVSAFLERAEFDAASFVKAYETLDMKLDTLDALIQEHPPETLTPLSAIKASLQRIAHNSVDINDLVVPELPTRTG